MAKISINTNREKIEIERDGEVVGAVYFDPTDLSLISRLRAVGEKSFNEADELEKLKNTEGVTEEQLLAEMGRIDQTMRKAIDDAFDYPCSDVVFGKGHAFNTHNGVSYVEQFVSGAISIIEKRMGAEADKAEKRQAKYLAQHKRK
jgi:hypothetical protein